MQGKDIPLETWTVGDHTEKRPKYELTDAETLKKKQDMLGENACWYYGTECKKCCGVYPAYMTENGFEANGYYVCLVCGAESKHFPMPWQAKESWNAGERKWKPEARQFTITESRTGEFGATVQVMDTDSHTI